MDTREYMHSGVKVDVCPEGHGVWLEEGEFAKIVRYLEHVVVSMDAGDYAKAALSELKEIVTHPEGFRAEMKDFSVVLRLLQTRFGLEHPKLVETATELSRRIP